MQLGYTSIQLSLSKLSQLLQDPR
uniref:Uncharacterized protein n=1 Tax=Rhizophora mucronata TaxID=61149 RepID=A0A2P2PNQ3_RHIMU